MRAGVSARVALCFVVGSVYLVFVPVSGTELLKHLDFSPGRE